MRHSLLLAPALMVACATPALAVPSGSVSGTLYTDVTAPLTGAPMSFNVTRTYLTGRLRADATWSGQITLNAYPSTFVSGLTGTTPTLVTEAHEEFLQLAYLQGENLYPGGTFQLGLVALPWTEYEYGFWGYRMLGPVPIAGGLARGTGFVQSWDKAVKLTGQHGWVSYGAAAFNGEGYRRTETTNQKGYQGRVTLHPLSGLELTALGQYGDPTTADGHRASAFIGYRTEPIKVAMQGTWTWDGAVPGRLLGAYWIVGLPIPGLPPLELVLRGDQIDPHLGITGDERLETIAGLSLKPTREVTLTLDHQSINRSSGSSQQVALHTALSF